MNEETRQIAISFLSDIPLSLQDACALCSKNTPKEHENSPHQSSHRGKDRLTALYTSGSSDVPRISPQHSTKYYRSISSYAGISTNIQIKPLQRQSSLNETQSCRLEHLTESQMLSYPFNTAKKPVTKLHLTATSLLLSKRIFLLESSYHTPCGVFSILPFVRDADKLKSQISSTKSFSMETPDHRSSHNPMDPFIMAPSKHVVSYESLLSPSKSEPVIELDCPEWTSGKHRTVLQFSGYMVSVIGYTKASELKRDLNQKFKQSFPAVNVTLSKLRSLERLMLRTAKVFGIQSGVLSCAKSYFERLVFSCAVNKFNRHHIAAACLLLSAKIHGDLTSEDVSRLVTALEHRFNTSKSTFLRFEFPIFAALKFSIMLPDKNRLISGE